MKEEIELLKDIKGLLQSILKYQKIQLVSDKKNNLRIIDNQVYYSTMDGALQNVETGEWLPKCKSESAQCGKSGNNESNY